MSAIDGPLRKALRQTLEIERLGQRGEGVAQGADGVVYIPYAVPGDVVIADVEGERGTLLEIQRASPARIKAFCPHYTVCGGCAVQTLAPAEYLGWKSGLVAAALSQAGVVAPLAPIIDAHGEGRRRATFHGGFWRDERGAAQLRVGFMQARAHTIVEIEVCPVLAPAMSGAIAAAHAVASALKSKEKPLDIVVTATDAGLDVDVRGSGRLDPTLTRKLVDAANQCDLARVSNHGEIVIERRAPTISMGRTRLAPPPGAFLQATQAGEATLASLVTTATKGARRVADLFSGVGTFALRLAETSEVLAVESDAPSLSALSRAAREATGLRTTNVERRDLFRRPLLPAELNPFDAVVLDPPRAGAQTQAQSLAASTVATVVGVSCNPATFARDAAILIEGGYVCESVTPVDQFRHSAHVEMVGVFRRTRPKRRMRGRLLG